MTNRFAHQLKKWGVMPLVALFAGCTSTPHGFDAVSPFDKEKYLGKWYEIARTDNRFQRGLTNAFAIYTLNVDGSIKVVNHAYNRKKQQWKSIVGKAKFVQSVDVGRLKVSFFGPFYGGYNVVAIDEAYENVLVLGDSPKYMWILSRHKTIPNQIKTSYLKKAEELGVHINQLIWAKHDQPYTGQ